MSQCQTAGCTKPATLWDHCREHAKAYHEPITAEGWRMLAAAHRKQARELTKENHA